MDKLRPLLEFPRSTPGTHGVFAAYPVSGRGLNIIGSRNFWDPDEPLTLEYVAPSGVDDGALTHFMPAINHRIRLRNEYGFLSWYWVSEFVPRDTFAYKLERFFWNLRWQRHGLRLV